MSKSKTPQELLDEIERTLLAEGHISSEPTPSRCDGCGQDKLDCSDHEGVAIENGTFCRDCWPDVDRVECLVGETGKAVQRYVRDGERHFVFLEPGKEPKKEPGKILLITKENWEWMPYFDPVGFGEDKLREQLRSHRLKFS